MTRKNSFEAKEFLQVPSHWRCRCRSVPSAWIAGGGGGGEGSAGGSETEKHLQGLLGQSRVAVPY